MIISEPKIFLHVGCRGKRQNQKKGDFADTSKWREVRLDIDPQGFPEEEEIIKFIKENFL